MINKKQYRDLYFNHWEAKKIVEIPVIDSLREKYLLKNLRESEKKILQKTANELELDSKLKEALYLERLDGGCIIYINYSDKNIQNNVKNDSKIESFELIPLDFIQINNLENIKTINPLEMQEIEVFINAQKVHPSRCIFFQGDGVHSIYYATVESQLSNFFGNSVLQPIFDDIKKAIRIRDIVYRITNKSSVIAALVDSLTLSDKEKVNEIKNLIKNVSNENSLIIDDANVKLQEFSASLGELPDLIITYLKILASSLDVPVTRFLGLSNSGLTQSADGDLENYYNMLEGYQTQHILPKLTQLYEKLYLSTFGTTKEIEIEFPPLWNLDEKEQVAYEQAKLNKIIAALNVGIIDLSEAIKEINNEKIFSQKISIKNISLNEENLYNSKK